ncbi:MAG: MBL fold metallo-hydrolase [Arcobacter sp.]|nr:MAG: MBL fold metallo-hydrolase [Arcobacter sp.]
MKITFLGTADSAGIPVHNCLCEVCGSYRKDKKVNLSTCAYIEIDNSIILLDAGHENISNIFDSKKIEAVFLTHFHADHCLGLLRLRHSFDTIKCFHPQDKNGFSDLFKHPHSMQYNIIKDFESKEIKGIKFTAIPLEHSKKTLGYLLEYKNKKIAYLSDCFNIKEKTMDFLKTKNLDYVFIDACYDENKTKENHFNYIQASKVLDILKAKNSYLMHISHTTQNYILKNNIQLKYKYLKENDEFNLS